MYGQTASDEAAPILGISIIAVVSHHVSFLFHHGARSHTIAFGSAIASASRKGGSMKRKVRTPYFETGVKCYIYGDSVLQLAMAANAASIKHDVDVLFIAPYVDIRRIRECCPELVIIAPFMDTLLPGRGMGCVLPEALREAGADGVVINHCEHPMINHRERAISLDEIEEGIRRANACDLLSFCCANTIEDAKAIARLHPDILNPEPSELIGSGQASDIGYVKEVIRAVKAIDSKILVEQAAGITTAQQVYDFIMAGSEAAGSASGLLNSSDPLTLLDEMVAAVRKAKNDLDQNKEANYGLS